VLAVHLAECFLLVTLATVLVDVFERSGAGDNLIWVANGLLLAYLLLAPRWRWPLYLLTGFAALLFGGLLIHEPWRMSLLCSLLDISEVLLAALLLRSRSTQLPRFTNISYLIRFIGFATLAAPVAVGLAYAYITTSWTHASLLYTFLEWAAPDCLGIAVITPTCVAIFQSDFSDRKRWRQNWIYLALTVALTVGAFCQDRIPLWILIYPLLVVIALRVDLGWAALSMLLAVITESCYTIRGEGPFAVAESTWPMGPGVIMQLYFAAGIFILYSISVVMERQKATESRLREIASLHKLVTENCRDAIILINFNGVGNYVSSAAEGMTGWSREELLKMGSIDLLHPEDQSNAVTIMSNLRSGIEGAAIEARLRQRSGEFLWVEASLRLIHDPVTGIPSGILKVVRDISERKDTERQLQEIVAMHKLVTENSRDIIILADFQGRRSYVSAVAESMGGWTRDELLAQESFGLVHPEDLAKAEAAVNELRAGAEGTMVECRAQKKNGEYVWVEANLHIVRDPATGAPSGVLNVLRDVSERKQAEQSREFQHSLIRAIHDVSLDGILVVDDEGKVVSYNKRFSDLWKICLTGIPVELRKDGTLPPDETMLAQVAKGVKESDVFLERVRELYANPEEDDQCQIELKDGRTLERYSTGLKSETGQYLGRVWFFSDITERRQAEQSREFHYSLIRAIHDVSLDGILVVDDEGKVVSYNKRFSEVWKICLAGIPVGLRKEFITPPDQSVLADVLKCVKDPDTFLERVRELYANPEEDDRCQIELKDGRTLERYSTSLKSETGQHLGRVWFHSDITERKRAEQKLQEAYSAVESLAVTDALTGLANRRRFDQYIAGEWRRGMRDGKPLSMLLLDVDFFKSYNDTYGHLRGDSCLRQIAESCQDVVARPGDLVARFGGEEFAIILPNTENEGAMTVANEVCLALRGRRLPHSSNQSGIVTVSIGCVTIVPLFGKHVHELIEMADQALYRAKNNGRNQVCSNKAVNLYEDMESFFTTMDAEKSKKG
jgi:diguanylate cyclase (GGDEF)-like protein/PAS domain S-box-containing protein